MRAPFWALLRTAATEHNIRCELTRDAVTRCARGPVIDEQSMGSLRFVQDPGDVLSCHGRSSIYSSGLCSDAPCPVAPIASGPILHHSFTTVTRQRFVPRIRRQASLGQPLRYVRRMYPSELRSTPVQIGVSDVSFQARPIPPLTTNPPALPAPSPRSSQHTSCSTSQTRRRASARRRSPHGRRSSARRPRCSRWYSTRRSCCTRSG